MVNTLNTFSINFVSKIFGVFQHAFSPDSQIAWGLIKIKDDLPSGETVDEWYPLSGKQGEEKEGMINVIMSVTVSFILVTFKLFPTQRKTRKLEQVC